MILLQRALLAHFSANETIGAYKSERAAQALTDFVHGSIRAIASETTLSAAQARAAGAVLTLPQTVNPLAVIVSGSPTLKLTARQLYLIYKGQLRSWAQIPGSGMRGAIVPVVRQDACADTLLFTTWLRKRGLAAARDVTSGPWKTGNRYVKFVSGDVNVVKFVKANKGAIAYVQAHVGAVSGIHAVALQSSTGAYAVPASVAVNALPLAGARRLPAAAAASAWAAFTLLDLPGTYPLLTFSYVLARPAYKGTATALQLKAFLRFLMAGVSQNVVVPSLGYKPIPGIAIGQNLGAIGSIAVTPA